MIVIPDDSGIVGSRSSMSTGSGGGIGDTNNKLSALANTVSNSLTVLLQNLKFTRVSCGQGHDGTRFLENSNVSFGNTRNGINPRITFSDCIIGGTVTVGISIALLHFSYFVWKRILVLYSRPRLKASQATENPNLRNKTRDCKTQTRHTCHEKMEGDGQDHQASILNVTPDHHALFVSQELKLGSQSTADTLYSISMKGSCQCKAVQFMLTCHQGIEYISEEGKSRLSKVPQTAVDNQGKIRFARLPIYSASKYFEMNPSSIPFLHIYHDLPVSSTSPSDGSTYATLSNNPRVLNAAYAFCSICGVHILYAPDSAMDAIEVNAHCLDGDFTNAGRKKNVLEESWRDLYENTPVQDEQREAPLSTYYDSHVPFNPLKSTSTPLTEATTITSASTGEYSRSILHDVSTSSSLDSDYSLSTTMFDGGDNIIKKPSYDEGVSTWPRCGSVVPIYEHNNGGRLQKVSSPVSDGCAKTIPICLTSRQQLGSIHATPLWKKNRRTSLIDSPLKQNLLHYMKKHLNSPSGIEAEKMEGTHD